MNANLFYKAFGSFSVKTPYFSALYKTQHRKRLLIEQTAKNCQAFGSFSVKTTYFSALYKIHIEKNY